MPTALVLWLLTQAEPVPRALWWLTERGAIPLACAAKSKGTLAFGPACRSVLAPPGTITSGHGRDHPWRRWGRAVLDPWAGDAELAALLEAPAPRGRELGVSPRVRGDAPALEVAPSVTVNGHRFEVRGKSLVDESGTVVLEGQRAASRSMEVAAVDLNEDGTAELVVLERCVNEERLTLIDASTRAKLFTWGYCGI